MQAENVTTSDQIVKLNKDISDIKNVLSTYSVYFKDHFSLEPGGTKNGEFKTQPPFSLEVFPLDKLSDQDIIYRLKVSDAWICLRALLEMNYDGMSLFNLIPWLDGVFRYASQLSGVANAYKSMQNDVEKDD